MNLPYGEGKVAVPKANGSVCICVDLKASNESVMRKIYPPSLSQA